jgi:hypothetical protein
MACTVRSVRPAAVLMSRIRMPGSRVIPASTCPCPVSSFQRRSCPPLQWLESSALIFHEGCWLPLAGEAARVAGPDFIRGAADAAPRNRYGAFESSLRH